MTNKAKLQNIDSELQSLINKATTLSNRENGATFTPAVSVDGVISWTNDKGLENPDPVNIKGEKGDKGDKGEQGIQGAQGIPGEKGDKGDKGDKGEQGTQGVQGIQGEKGDKGDTGATGKSAYQYAKDGGYIGTEADFKEKLATAWSTAFEASELRSAIQELATVTISMVTEMYADDYNDEDPPSIREIAENVVSSLTTETWTFTLDNGSTVSKKVVLG